jgi:chromosome segregation ATPase
VREARERQEALEVGRNSAFERQLEMFETQRQEYNGRIDRLQGEALDKDRQLGQLQMRLERLQDDAERRRGEADKAKEAAERDRKAAQEKAEGLKRRLQEAQDEAMRQKLDFGRE